MLRGQFEHLNVDLASNQVTAPWVIGAVHLTPREAEVLTILCTIPGPVPIGRIIARVYGDQEPDHGRKAVHVYVYHLRKKIAPMGLIIRTHGSVPGEDWKYELRHV